MDILSAIVTIGLATLSTATWFAYTHPLAFKKLKLPLELPKIGFYLLVVYAVWHQAIITSFDILSKFISTNDILTARAKLDNLLLVRYEPYFIFAGFFGLWFVVLVLHFLRDFIDYAEKKKK